MKIKIKQIESKICTDNKELLKALYTLYSFNDPKAIYSPIYKRGLWDGKKHFISNTGRFKTGLLPRLLEDLEKINCVPDLDYQYNPIPEKIYDFSIEDWEYRDYQSRYIYEALSRKRSIIESATASGKTLIIAGLIKALANDHNIVVFFTQKSLIHQTYEFLVKKPPKGVFLPKDQSLSIGIASGDGFQYGRVMLVSAYSAQKIIGTPHEDATVLLVDEVHEFAGGKYLSKLIHTFPNAEFRIGLTGTVPKDDIKRYTLEGAFGPVIKEITTQELIELKSIAKPNIQFIPIIYNYKDYDEYSSYLKIYEKYIVNNNFRNNLIKQICEKISKEGAKVLILVKDLQHASNLHNTLEGSFKLEGEDSIPKRQSEVNKFLKQKDGAILIGTKIFQTGINIPEITHLINARGLKAEISTLQALGRAMRVTNTKKEVFVYDFLDEMKYLERHAKSRIKHYKRDGHSVTILPEVIYENK